ncbi:MAG: phosphoribosylamine--glycine ligase [Betaproteobacteria bacterium]|jgi:phosphoribosylamine--glycine ligase|nr:MAG: phosphoribosylamine--glycine ligase [Betaproteobacteria bacterium]
MDVLVIGGGGREHALAWRLARSRHISRVYVAPGNAGTARDEGIFNVAISAANDLIEFAKRESISMTVVGPEAPLSEGIVDAFRAAGLRIFGPTQAAAQLESSKGFAKAFMAQHGIPTSDYRIIEDARTAHDYIHSRGAPIVIKADGLAAGKGVIVAQTEEEAHRAVDMMLVEQSMGVAGARVVIEDFIHGEEASFIAMVDGQHVLALASSQDHKRLLDGDGGPNTGGMGAYSPAPIVTPAIHARVMREVIQPVVKGMADAGTPYVGFLYAGLMITADGAPKVLEFNCRLGDPETQPIMLRLKSDLYVLFDRALKGELDKAEAEWDRRVALGVVMAAAGYPASPRKGDEISGLPVDVEDAHVFHAGTTENNGNIVTNGGRVLCVTALGDTVRVAQRRAYEIAKQIRFDGMQMRTDIGFKAINARKSTL